VKDQPVLLQFNRGRISPLALARIDLKRAAISAEIQTNFIPRALGPMSLRPGLRYINQEIGDTRCIPFVFAADDSALIEMHDDTVSFVIDDVRLTRPVVTAAITNGNFTTDVSGWTATDAGIFNAWVTGGYLGLSGDGSAIASRQQQVTVTQVGIEHALRIVVFRGPVSLTIGSTSNGTEYRDVIELKAGHHSISFTPTGASFYVKVWNQTSRRALVDSISVENGDVYLTAPWSDATMRSVRWDQSGDIVFLSVPGGQQRRILRWAARSWSIETYAPDDGPFLVENTSTMVMTPSALDGIITVTSDAVSGSGAFRAGNLESIYSLTSVGQTVTAAIAAQNTFTTSIAVSGITTARTFGVVITGTFVATVTLQRSFDFGATWQDTGTIYTAPTSTVFTDGLENQLIEYRIGIKTGGYTSGTATCTLTYSAGSITGTFRVTEFVSTTQVTAEVLSPLGGVIGSAVWAEGAWSPRRGYPSAVAFHEGRLWWAGKDKFWGSITDAFDRFDPNFLGDAGPISRSIGSGPVDKINWLVALQRLLAGTGGSIVSCRSSSFDEVLTPTNFNPKIPVTQGSAAVNVVKIDESAIYVQQNGKRVIELSATPSNNDYGVTDLTELVPEVGSPGIVWLAVQRQPDTRVHCGRSDGTVALLVFNKAENVVCWVDIETQGNVIDGCVLPGIEEDSVYYVVERTQGGGNVTTCLEKWAMESECVGGLANLQADSFVVGTNVSTLSGLDRFYGLTLVVWADGKDRGEFLVTGSSINLGATYNTVMAGLPYTAQFKGARLAHATKEGYVGLSMPKRIHEIGLILSNCHAKGIRFGQNFDTMDELPDIENFADVDPDSVHETYDKDFIALPGEWETDARLCLEAQAPRPATVLAAVLNMNTS
jgi:hypothetical protein